MRSKKLYLYTTLLILFIFLKSTILLSQTLTNLPDKPIGKLSYFTGKGKIYKTTEKKEYDLKIDFLISSDDIIFTEKESKVEITLLENKTVITIFENSKLSLSQILNKNNDNSTVLSLFYGKIKLIISKITGKEEFIVNTPTGIASVRGTDFEVATSELGDSLIKVYEGKVQVYDDDEKYFVETIENETTIVEFNRKPQKIEKEKLKEEHLNIDSFINIRNKYSAQIANLRIKEMFKILNILNKNIKFLDSKVNEIYNNKSFQQIFQILKEGKELDPQQKGYLTAFRNMLSTINYITYKHIYKIKIIVELIKNILPKANLSQNEINNYQKELNRIIENIETLFTKILILNRILN